MFKVAMLSGWHVHAAGYARQLNGIEGCAVAYVWDEDAARGEAWAKELDVPFVADLDELLAKKDYQGVIVSTPTTMHEDVITKAAKAKKHIFTEKALATNVAACKRIAAAVREGGVEFCISYPYRVMPMYLYAKDLMDKGLLGDVSLMRMRNGHDGSLAGWLPPYWYDKSLTGGGALMDLGCHPCYLADWLLGAPAKVSAAMTFDTGRETDDTAVCMAEFKNGAVAILETSLMTPYSPGILELYGTKGSMRAVGDRVEVRLSDSPGWFVPPALPKAQAMPMDQWIDGIKTGKRHPFDLDAATRLTALLEAAYTSHETGKPFVF